MITLSQSTLIPESTAKKIREGMFVNKQPAGFGSVAAYVGNVNYNGLGYYNDPESVTSINISATYGDGAGGLLLTELTNLQNLECQNCDLSFIDASNLKFLTGINTAQNYVSDINIAGCDALVGFEATSCSIKEFNASNLPNLQSVNFIGGGFNTKKINVQNCSSLTTLNASYCYTISEINISGCSSLTDLDARHNSFSATHNDNIFLELSGNGNVSGSLALNNATGVSGALAKDYLVNTLDWTVVLV